MTEDRGAVHWRKSTYSNDDDPNCCEVALLPDEIRVRDSKLPHSSVLRFAPDAWRAALALFLALGTGRHEARP
ncbi:DUF397 domain-containing protein [Streptomyces sp. NPDC048171]|uniref:DUF397 domain-containing protein n=1 Tax=unclassified Streptomyces TaxID=2593676 RepID=UPI001371C7F1|nr:DUF397 domain-containing protein [Streptomyces sp. SID5789]MZE73834.1 DUF397 domain-containing protein [Streptomyces sp. SID5789]